MASNGNNQSWVSTKELAVILCHNHKTIRRWLQKGIITAEEGKSKFGKRGIIGRPRSSTSLKFDPEKVKLQLVRHFQRGWEV